MPELPEVEVTRLGLTGAVNGAMVSHARLGKPLRWPLGACVDDLVGCVVLSPSRRGKYLWFPMQRDGCDAGGLLIHLGMSGSLTFHPTGSPSQPDDWPELGTHDHFELWTDRGCLRLHDPRRFGAVVWAQGLDRGQAARLLAGLGVEPLTADWTPQRLRAGVKGRRMSIKLALLAGDIVVGVGNIYASEALFRAGIHPETPAHRVGLPRCERLVASVRAVLSEAVAAGGSTLRDFRNALGESGHFQLSTRVYDREGQPCTACSTPIRRVVQGQRSTYYCPKCQRR